MGAQRDISKAQRLLKQVFPALVFSARRLSSGQIRGVFLEWCVEEKQFVRDAGLAAIRRRWASAPERTLIFGFDDESAVRARDTDGLLKSEGVAYVGLINDPSGLRERIAEKIKDLLRSDVGVLAHDAVRRSAGEFGKALRDGVWHRVVNIRYATVASIPALRAQERSTRQKEYRILAGRPRSLLERERRTLAALVKQYTICNLVLGVDVSLKALDKTLQAAAAIEATLVETLQSGYSDDKCRQVVDLIQRLSETINKGESLVPEIGKLCSGATCSQ